METIMWSSLEPEEVEYLTKQFRLTTNVSQDRRCSIKAIDLLDEQRSTLYMDRLTDILQSPSRMITASQFAKRYAFLIVAPSLYAMTMYNKGLNLSIENCHVDDLDHNENWVPNIRLTDLHVTQPSTSGKRHEWRDQVIKNIFAGNLVKIWRSISKVSNVPMSILWENTAVRVYSLYEKKVGEGGSEQERSRIQGDFQYLINEAPAVLFGETKNPLAKYYVPKCTISSSDQPVRIRKTCCYYYKVSSNGEYCSTCPKITI
jgi:ferric iron reductase protein FhuF